MSYSDSAQAATKELAKAAIATKVDAIVASQPIHARDKAAILANANTVIDLLADDDARDVRVNINGYLTWNGADPETAGVSYASVNCYAQHIDRT